MTAAVAGPQPLPEFAGALEDEADRLLRLAAWLPVVATDALVGETGITVRTLLVAFLFGEDAVCRWFQQSARGGEADRLLARPLSDAAQQELRERAESGALPEVGGGLALISPSARTVLRKARWLKRRVAKDPRQDRIGCRHILGCYAFLQTAHAFLERRQAASFSRFLRTAAGRRLIGDDNETAWKEVASGVAEEDGRLIAAIERNEAGAALEIGRRAEAAGEFKRAFEAYASAVDLGAADAATDRERVLRRARGTEPLAEAEAERATTTPAAELIANLGNDDPEAPGVEDRLKTRDEAHAFARLAASRAVRPPLAIGIFGEWGSGKSFFMRLIREHIDRLSRSAGGKDGQSHYLADIVQIRFNAWHYMEHNLWASLVDTIFCDLDRWISERTDGPKGTSEFMNRLATARLLTLEAAEALVRSRREQAEAAKRLADAERQLAEARLRASLSPLDVAEAFAEVLRPELDALGKEAQAALEATGLDRLAGDAAAFRAALADLTDERRRAGILAAQVGRQLASPAAAATVIGLIAVLPAALAVLTAGVGAAAGAPWLQQVGTVAVPAATALAGATAALHRLLATVRPHLDRLAALKAALDRRLQARLAAEEGARAAAAVEVAKRTAAAEGARAELQAATAAVAAAIEAYAADSGSRRLRRFVRERAGDGTYARHLGLIATIRRDFEQLSRLMLNAEPEAEGEAARRRYAAEVKALIEAAGAHLTDKEKGELEESARSLRDTAAAREARFERVVLYIDDLDRCPPAKVVEVLQAIHLLLHFRLFVVFVAVDARWVARSLKDVYPDLLAETVIRPGTGEQGTWRNPSSAKEGDGRGAEGGVERAASSQDYLEKIFQIPYWVRRMADDTSRDFVEHVARQQPEPVVSAGPAGAPPPTEPRAAIVAEGAAVAPVGTGPSAAVEGEARPVAAEEPTPAEAAAAAGEAATLAGEEEAAEFLAQGEEEIACMRQLAPFVGGTPRRGLRFVNVYRLIKTGLAPAIREALVGTDGKALGYRALLTQVAVVTGSPRCALGYFDALIANGGDGRLAPEADLAALIEHCRHRLPDDGDKTTLLATLAAVEARNREDGVSCGTDFVTQLRVFAPLAARYAFTARRH